MRRRRWLDYLSQAATDAGTVSFPMSVTTALRQRRPLSRDSCSTPRLALLTLSIVSRAIAVERPPIGNLWEYTVALGWGIILFTAVFERGFNEKAIPAVMLPGRRRS